MPKFIRLHHNQDCALLNPWHCDTQFIVLQVGDWQSLSCVPEISELKVTWEKCITSTRSQSWAGQVKSTNCGRIQDSIYDTVDQSGLHHSFSSSRGCAAPKKSPFFPLSNSSMSMTPCAMYRSEIPRLTL